jgi:hypothetical protein
LIDRDFSHFSHGENALFVQNIEIAQLRNEVCRCAANDVLCNDVPAAPEMMQPPQAAIVPQGTHHLSAGQHHFPQGTSCHAKNVCQSRRFLRGVSSFKAFRTACR